MKIWITRSSGFSIQCGGLERLFVWFREPRWVVSWRPKEHDDMPFGDNLSDKCGRKNEGWEVMQSGTMWIDGNVSFGKMFGYGDGKNGSENEIANYVWGKVQEHFLNEPFENWHTLDKEGKTKIEDFLLELEIKIQLILS